MKRGDPCVKCGKLGYYATGICRECRRVRCPKCGKVSVGKDSHGHCASCFRRIQKAQAR